MIQVRITVDPKFEAKYRQLGYFMASKFYDLLKKNIESNKYGFSNAASTVKRKGFNHPMVDSGEYLKQIMVSDNTVVVREGTHTSGITFTELASMLEYGRRDEGFTGFPVWRLTLEEFKEQIPELLNKHFKQ